MGIRVPAHLQDTARTCTIKSWVKKRGFATKDYFTMIDEARTSLQRFNPEPADAHIVGVLASAVDAEDSFIGHVLGLGVEITSPEKWFQMCTAAGWVILQAYYAATEKGDWP